MIIWTQDKVDKEAAKARDAWSEKTLEDLAKKTGTKCLEKEGIDPDLADRLAVSLSIVGEEEIRQLNREYRDKDSVTDVLSFPMFNGSEDIKEAAASYGYEDEDPDWVISIGDIVMCSDRIIWQAKEYGHSEMREFSYLMAHSMLHLLGYDHEDEEEKRIMRSREDEIMEEMDVPAAGDVSEKG